MKVLKPEGLKEIKGGEVGDCVCSHGSRDANREGFFGLKCGHQCSYGATNDNANLQRAQDRPWPREESKISSNGQ